MKKTKYSEQQIAFILRQAEEGVSVGRLDPQKDHATLIRAFALISEEFPEWDLKIIGEGRLRSQLEDLVSSYKLVERISLPGISKDIMKEYMCAQTFVISSIYESFGLATAEAMSAGLPVIGFADCPGTNELVHDQDTGILVTIPSGVSREEALARQLRLVLSSAEMRATLGQKAREYISQSFNLNDIINRWVNIIS